MFKINNNKKFDILVTIVIFILACFLTHLGLQNDTFYSLAIGKDILKNGIDMLDHYSIHGLTYTYPHWLFDVLLYLIYNLFSFKGLYVFNILFLFLITLILYKVSFSFNKNRLFSGVLAILSMFIMRNFIANRAQTITYILFILEIFCVENYLKTGKNKYFIFLSIILLLIFNMHIAVWPMFYILLMPYIFEYMLAFYKEKNINTKYLKKESNTFINNETGFYSDRFIFEKNDNIKKLILYIPFSLFIGFITPIGLNSYTYILKTFMGSSTYYIAEHQPIVLINEVSFTCILLSIIIVFIFTKAKFKFRDFVTLSGLILMTFSSYRHLSFLTLLWVILYGRNLANYIDNIDPSGSNKIINLLTKKISFVIIILISFLIGWLNKPVIVGSLEESLIPSYLYPKDASEYILKELDYESIRLYNDYDYGSYLLFKGIPVYIDSRADLYTKEFNNKKDIMKEHDSYNYYNYGEILKENKVTHIIVRKSDNIRYMYDKDEYLKQIYKDDYFVLYEVISNY